MAKTTRNHVFDAVVIGRGLGATLLTDELSQRGLKLALISEEGELQHLHRWIETTAGPVPQTLEYLPASEELKSAIQGYESLWNRKLLDSEQDTAVETFDSGQFKPFLGFGDQAPECLDVIESYIQSRRSLQLNAALPNVIQSLRERWADVTLFEGDVITSCLTEKSRLTELTLNGRDTLSAQFFFWVDSTRRLMDILPPKSVPTRLRQKIAKAPAWTHVHLTLVHPRPMSTSPSLFLFMGSKLEPCLGRFLPYSDEPTGHQVSNWVTFVPAELMDEESVAQYIKETKRQIRRAFPEAFDGLLYERLVIEPRGFELLEDVRADIPQPLLDNLWLASPQMVQQPPLAGHWIASHQALQAYPGENQETTRPPTPPEKPEETSQSL